MDVKILNTIFIVALMFLIIIGGGGYIFYFQDSDIEKKTKKLEELKKTDYDTQALKNQLDTLKIRAAELDSILSLRKFNIPVQVKQSHFYDFINRASSGFSRFSHVNVEYIESIPQKHFSYFTYNITGTADFNDLYSLVYAIEQSKELKKIIRADLTNLVKVDEDGVANYLVSYKMDVRVYFSDNDRFASSEFKENNLLANPLYDIFYPLIRDAIPPNTKKLLDVQNARLLAIVPDGAYLADEKGSTFLLWEGEEVYLGYLTDIDFDNNKVSFILNKGGIIEKIVLELEKKNKNEK